MHHAGVMWDGGLIDHLVSVDLGSYSITIQGGNFKALTHTTGE